MGEIRVQGSELITDKNIALSHQGSANSDIEITLNKNKEIPQLDKATEKQIKTFVAILYPEVNWNSLSDIEKQGYIVQFYDGTLKEKFNEFLPKMEEFKASIKNLSPEEASNKIIQTVMERKDPNFKNYSQEEQQKHINLESLQLLKEFNPKLDIENMSEKEKAIQLDCAKFKLQTACYAYQTGKIEKLEEFKNYTPTQIHDLEYEFAKETQKTYEDFTTDTMKFVIAKGDLDRAIAEKNNISLEEFRESEDKYNLMLKYLKEKPEAELNEFETKQLNTLKKLAFIYGDDLKGMNLTQDGSITDSYLHQLSGGEKTNWQDPVKFKILRDKMQADIEQCKTPEEKRAKIAEILSSCRGDLESAAIISEAFAILEKTNVIAAEDLFEGAKQAHISSHGLVACSHHMSEQGQKCTAEHVANHCHGEHSEFTAKQAAGYTVNMIPQYEVEAQAHSTNVMTDTGLKEVHNVLPDTYSKLDQSAAKASFEHAMNSNAVSDEQKAIIARDTIDNTDNADLKKFYQDLANKYNVDYTTVPPKSERTNAPANNKSADNNTNSNTKVAGTDYTQQEVANILAKASEAQNPLAMAGKALQETVDIILGKTPENNLQAKIPTITSLNTAITQLKNGTKLNDVFRQSNNETKKELVAIICTYGKTAIASLIDAFGGQTIYKLAKNDNARALIKKELERIALSNSTQRAELAEIKKTEAKEGMTPQRA